MSKSEMRNLASLERYVEANHIMYLCRHTGQRARQPLPKVKELQDTIYGLAVMTVC